jgi:hypothetical protein
MPEIESTYERILAYLKGLLSGRQRHDLEKEMMHDVFEEEAFEGLSQLSASELEADMDALTDRLKDRIAPAEKRSLKIYFRAAAGIILLLGLGTILYLVFRKPEASLITEKKNRQETVIRPAPEAKSEPLSNNEQSKDQISGTKDLASAAVKKAIPAEGKRMADALAVSEAYSSKSYTRSASPGSPGKDSGEMFTGRVVDIDGQALANVHVSETGTDLTTLTDSNGKFSLPLVDSGLVIALHLAGFRSAELQVRDKTGDIILQDDLSAMDELVVLNYGKKRSENDRSARSALRTDENLKSAPKPEQVLQEKAAGVQVSRKSENVTGEPVLNEPAEFNNLVKPLPPYGSLKEFKKWMTDRLDQKAFKSLSGKQRILVDFTVNKDGIISDILIGNKVPEAMATELKKVISQSPAWKPALRDNIPVESRVAIRFMITPD